jgi:flagellar basal body L-ring protein FlgH
MELQVIKGTLVNGKQFVKIDTRQLTKSIKIKVFGVFCIIDIDNHNIAPYAKIVEGEVYNGEGVVSYTNK